MLSLEPGGGREEAGKGVGLLTRGLDCVWGGEVTPQRHREEDLYILGEGSQWGQSGKTQRGKAQVHLRCVGGASCQVWGQAGLVGWTGVEDTRILTPLPQSKGHSSLATPLLTPGSPTGTSAVTTGSELLFRAPGLDGSLWETFAVSPERSGALVLLPRLCNGERHSESRVESTQRPLSSSWGRTHPLSFSPAGYPQIRSYNVQVATTDYDQFAMVFFKKRTSGNKQYFKVTLYGEFLADA